MSLDGSYATSVRTLQRKLSQHFSEPPKKKNPTHVSAGEMWQHNALEMMRSKHVATTRLGKALEKVLAQ